MFSLLWAQLKGGALGVEKRELVFCHFIATNHDKHTTFQLLATKGDNEVVTARLAASIEYGTHNSLPSYIGVL
jgi:hypothetical protein